MSTSLIPLTVIGGYLGAGKTTLLNHLLRHNEGRRYAILVNDFGSINIDAALIESQDDKVIRLDNGCLCCSLASGLAVTLNNIRLMDPRPDHVIVEASGVADPVRIRHYAYVEPFQPEGVLVVADAETVRQKCQDPYVGDSVLRQLQRADLVIVNKTDLISPSQRDQLREWLAQSAPGVRQVEAVQGRIPHSLIHCAPRGRAPEAEADHPEYRSWSLVHSEPLAEGHFRAQVASWPETVLRAKGFVHLREDSERRYLFQWIGKHWSLTPDRPWAHEPRRTELVVIALAGQLEGQALLESMTPKQQEVEYDPR